MVTVTGGSRAAAMHSAELAIGGMTCASCAASIEKKLNKLDGVTATVNFATETARVFFPASVSTGDLVSSMLSPDQRMTFTAFVRQHICALRRQTASCAEAEGVGAAPGRGPHKRPRARRPEPGPL